GGCDIPGDGDLGQSHGGHRIPALSDRHPRDLAAQQPGGQPRRGPDQRGGWRGGPHPWQPPPGQHDGRRPSELRHPAGHGHGPDCDPGPGSWTVGLSLGQPGDPARSHGHYQPPAGGPGGHGGPMTLVVPNVAEADFLSLILGKIAQESMLLKLYANDLTPGFGTVIGDLTELASTGYAAVTLTPADWTVTASSPSGPATAQAPQKTYGITAAATSYGYYLVGATSGQQIG